MIEITRLENIRPSFGVHYGSLMYQLSNENPVTIGKYLVIAMPDKFSNGIEIRQLGSDCYTIVDQQVLHSLIFTGEVKVYGSHFADEETQLVGIEPFSRKEIIAYLLDSVGTHYRIRVPLKPSM